MGDNVGNQPTIGFLELFIRLLILARGKSLGESQDILFRMNKQIFYSLHPIIRLIKDNDGFRVPLYIHKRSLMDIINNEFDRWVHLIGIIRVDLNKRFGNDIVKLITSYLYSDNTSIMDCSTESITLFKLIKTIKYITTHLFRVPGRTDAKNDIYFGELKEIYINMRAHRIDVIDMIV